MLSIGQKRDHSRMKAVAGVVALHALVGYAFITGLAFEVTREVTQSLQVFDISEPPPPPEEAVEPAPARAPEPEGAAAPESMDAVVVPEPEIWLAIAPPVQTARAKGTSDVPGAGTGSGGEGTGTGSGGSGTGTGGGGGARAQRLSGGFTPQDYRRIAGPRNLRGVVHVSYVVEPDGRVTGCSVTRSSGHPELDSATCRLIEQRFRYRPARDAQGRAVQSTQFTNFTWEPR